MNLQELIVEKIHRQGPIPFIEYMEMALYHPGLGYYTSGREKFGRQGDYYTSAVLSSLYGKMIARQVVEMWHHTGKGAFNVVEYGAGTGMLCRDIMQALSNEPIFPHIQYYIIEKSESLRQKQQTICPPGVQWISSIAEISGFTGCVLASEVLDNFAIHLVSMEETLQEIYVDYKKDFKEVLRQARPELIAYFAQQHIVLSKPYRTEINLEALSWLQQIAEHMDSGYLITIDYGYLKNDYYSAKRSLGTLACYSRHQVTADPYSDVGSKDITAHVNFSALHEYGLQYGLETCGYTNQNYFMRSLGLAGYLRELETEDLYSKEVMMQVNKLLFDMGDKFKILIQSKGIPRLPLTGMMFSAPINS